MNIVSGIVAFSIIWMVVLFAVLPFGVRTAEEAGLEVEKGHAESAPAQPRIGRKFLITTAIAAVIFAVYWYFRIYDPFEFGAYFR